MATFYTLFKTLHIISFVAWFAGLFYLPRLFIYHREAMDAEPVKKEILTKEFSLLEHRLYKIIMNPAMMATWTFGILMIVINTGLLKQGWLHTKITLVIVLLAYHLWCKKVMKRLANGEQVLSSKGLRLANEIPTVLLLLIVPLPIFGMGINMPILFGVVGLITALMTVMILRRKEGSS